MATNVIPSNSPSVFAALSSSSQNGAASLNAIAYPSPLPNGIAGLIFDWTGDEKLSLQSDITDSWIEDNTAIQDQIALLPERFTVDASTAEIVFNPQGTTNQPPQPANPFPLNPSMVPTLTPGAAAAEAASSAPSAAAPQATSSLFGFYQGLGNTAGSRQATVMGFIYQLWLGRVLFTVETPWGIFDNMAIELADGTQPQDTPGRTDHRITFKKIRLAGDPAIEANSQLGRALNQAAEADPSQPGGIGQIDFSDQQSQQLIGNWTLLGGNSSGGSN